MNFLAISKAKTKKQPKAKIKPVVAIVGIRAIPKAEQIANKTHLITYNIIIPSFSCFNTGPLAVIPIPVANGP